MIRQELDELIKSWDSLKNRILQLNEEETEYLLNLEKVGKRRPSVILRLYGRFSKLRGLRERKALYDKFGNH